MRRYRDEEIHRTRDRSDRIFRTGADDGYSNGNVWSIGGIKMNPYEAWRLDAIIEEIGNIENIIAEAESDYPAEDFDRIMDNLSKAKESLHTAWMMI